MKVAIYCRLSEEDKNKLIINEDSESIQNQKNMLIEHSLKNGWKIYDIYSDDDFKGSDRNRPEFNRLLLDAENNKFDIILCKSQSRFTRELELVEKYIHGKFIEWNIRFIGYADNADTENIGNKKSRQINGLVNEWYLEDISNNIRSVFDTKKRAGYHIGSFALYGYKKNPNRKGHLIIDEKAAKIVREVFQLFVSGYGKTNIARMLNEKGIPNPTEYKRLNGKRFKHTSKNNNSTLWKYNAIHNMLKNEMYIGTMVQNKQRNLSYKNNKKIQISKDNWIKISNTHEPIISIELWNKAQSLIKQRFRAMNETKKIGIFANKVKCKECGYNLRTQKSRNKHYLQCSTKYISKNTCSGCFISVKKLEEVVLKNLNNVINKYNIKNEIYSYITLEEHIQKNITLLNQNIIQYNKEITEYTNLLKTLYVDKVKGLISAEDFISLSTDFKSDKEKYQVMIKNAKKESDSLLRKLSSFNVDEIIEKYIDINKLERIHVDTLIDYIEIDKTSNVKEREINIYWNF